jgi:aspartyl protease family protein
MSDGKGPWHHPPPKTPARHAIWWALIAAGVLGIALLWHAFPNALSTYGAQGQFMRSSILLVLVASSLVYSRRFTGRESLRNAALWCAILAALGLGYTFYHQIRDAASEMRTELVPGYPTQTDADHIVFSENSDGNFEAVGKVNGAPVEFLIDTGASDIVLSPADAKRAGIDMAALQYGRITETANGEGRVAPASAAELQIGPVKLVNIDVSVNEAPMRSSLLGMAFLKRMKSFEMKGRKLTVQWR